MVAVPALQAIGIGAALEGLIIAAARDQRVIPGFAQKWARLAVSAHKAIGTVAAIEVVSFAPARDQRVVAGIAIEVLSVAGTALQAIGIGAAIEEILFLRARDQRVIPSFTKKGVAIIPQHFPGPHAVIEVTAQDHQNAIQRINAAQAILHLPSDKIGDNSRGGIAIIRRFLATPVTKKGITARIAAQKTLT